MGTRGAFGFRLKGQDYVSYNHFDSYPDGKGADILKFIADGISRVGYDGFIGEIKQRILSLMAVDNTMKPTSQQMVWLKPFTDVSVSNRSTEDWYCLLRNAQGDMEKMLNARYYVSNADFLHDSLFCEYAYIVNLDDEMFEFYRGFQPLNTLPPNRGTPGRYRDPKNKPTEPDEEYGSVALIATYPLVKINSLAAVEKFIKAMNEATGAGDAE